MSTIDLTPILSEAYYFGIFKRMAFNLLAAPAPTYQNILDVLGKYGASLKDLKYDASILSDAHISCALLKGSIYLKVRLDGLGLSFYRLNETGEELATQVLRDCWQVVSKTDPSLEMTRHDWAVTIMAETQNTTYDQTIKKYLTLPGTMPDKASASISISIPGAIELGEGQGLLAIESVETHENRFMFKISGNFEADKVSFDMLPKHIVEYIRKYLGALNLNLKLK